MAKTKICTFSAEPEFIEFMKDEAWRHKMSLSAYLRFLVNQEAMKKDGE